MATSSIDLQQTRGEVVAGGGNQKAVKASGKHRRALRDVGNLVTVGVEGGKPLPQINRPVTSRSFAAQLLAKAQAQAAANDKTKKQVPVDVAVVGKPGALRKTVVVNGTRRVVAFKPNPEEIIHNTPDTVEDKQKEKPKSEEFIDISSDTVENKQKKKPSRGGRSSRKKVQTYTSVLTARNKAAFGIANRAKETLVEIVAADAEKQLAAVEYVEDSNKIHILAGSTRTVHDYMDSQSDITIEYEKLEKVGEGSYGKVYRAREKATGKIVALKKTLIHVDKEGVPPTTLREISILRMLSNDPCVVRLLDVKQGQNKEGKTILYLVFEYMDTDLKKFIKSFSVKGETIPPQTVKNLMYQLCKGVAFCHGHGVLHRDLKPHNLLMNPKTMMLKIADLGLARAFTLPMKQYTHEILTLWYRAPEVLLGGMDYSTPVDMWSVGCIFAELITGKPLFAGKYESQQLRLIFSLLGTPNEQMWPGVSKHVELHEFPRWSPQKLSSAVPNLRGEGLDLLSKMLQYEPSSRISAKKAMEHPYFDDLDKT